MAQEYLDRLNALIGRLPYGSLKGVKLECKHFFSGAAVYADGRICMSWTPVGFAMKLPETVRSVLVSQQGAKYLRYFPQGPIKKEYVVLQKSMLQETGPFRHLAKASIEYVLSLPAPVKRTKSNVTLLATGRAKTARR